MLESILNLPIAPRIEKEEDVGNDNRYNLVLLHREIDTYTVLGLPYGADLTAKVEVPSAIYFKASPDEVRYKTINNPKLSLIKHKDYIYPIIEDEDEKKVIPYKTKDEFPINYADNRLYSYMQKQAETMCKTADEIIAELTKRNIKKCIELIPEFYRLGNTFSNKAYNLIEEIFSEEPVSSSRMSRLERKLKHFPLKNLTIEIIPELEGENIKTIRYYLREYFKSLFRDSLKHVISPTLVKRNFIFEKRLKKESSKKRTREELSAIKEIYPTLFKNLKELNNEVDNIASKRFRNLAFVTGVGAMPFNLSVGIGIISYGLVDRFFAKRHATREGTYTGLIGQIRDQFIKEELRDFYFFDVSKKGYLI